MFSSGQLILDIFWTIKCADVRTTMGKLEVKNNSSNIARHYENANKSRIPSESPGARRGAKHERVLHAFFFHSFRFPISSAAYRFTFQVRQTVGCLYFNLSLFVGLNVMCSHTCMSCFTFECTISEMISVSSVCLCIVVDVVVVVVAVVVIIIFVAIVVSMYM